MADILQTILSLKFVPRDSIDDKSVFGSGSGLARNRRQAITWTNDDQFNGAYMRHPVPIS